MANDTDHAFPDANRCFLWILDRAKKTMDRVIPAHISPVELWISKRVKMDEYLPDKFDRLCTDGEGRKGGGRGTVDRVHKYRWKSRDIPGGFAIPRLSGSSVTFCNINVPRDPKEACRLTMRNTRAEDRFLFFLFWDKNALEFRRWCTCNDHFGIIQIVSIIGAGIDRRNVYFHSQFYVILSRDRHESRRDIRSKGKMEGKVRENGEERNWNGCSPYLYRLKRIYLYICSFQDLFFPRK